MEKLLEERYALEYIKDMLNDMKLKQKEANDVVFHHNTSYEDASSVCEHGILTMSDMKKLGVKDFSDEFLKKMDDIESHANGINAVSLAKVGLEDLYPDEDYYDPFCSTLVDFNVCNVPTGRYSVNYGNEFLHRGSISVDKLRAIDIRLLKLIKEYENKSFKVSHKSIEDIVNYYNNLSEIALVMKSKALDFPFREMSEKNYELDIDKMSENPKLVLK